MSPSPWAAITNYHGRGGLDSRYLEAVRSKVMVPAESGPCGTSSWFADGRILPVPSHGGKGKLRSLHLLMRALIPQRAPHPPDSIYVITSQRLHLHTSLHCELGFQQGRLGGHNQLAFGILQRRVYSSPHWSVSSCAGAPCGIVEREKSPEALAVRLPYHKWTYLGRVCQ